MKPKLPIASNSILPEQLLMTSMKKDRSDAMFGIDAELLRKRRGIY